jgi:hypothetical protein
MWHVMVSHSAVVILLFLCRYMRYATTAYGVSMMESAERLVTFKPIPQHWSIFGFLEHMVQRTNAFVLHSWDKVNKAKIERYLNMKPYDVLHITPLYIGGSAEILYITPLYVGGSTEILYITPLYVGGSTKILRHFVAVDTKMKAVVLAIRGTFTVSGAATDLNGTAGE